jgi:hypothetical protein
MVSFGLNNVRTGNWIKFALAAKVEIVQTREMDYTLKPWCSHDCEHGKQECLRH